MQTAATSPVTVKRRPGRPPTYVFDRPDEELTENERRLRSAVLKRRERQNRSYRRRKLAKSQQLAAAAALRAASAQQHHPLPTRTLALPNNTPLPNVPQHRPAVSSQQSHLALFDSALSAPLPHPPPAHAHSPVSEAPTLRPPLYHLPRLQSPCNFSTPRLPPSTATPTLPPPHIPAASQGAALHPQTYETNVSPYAFDAAAAQHTPPAAPRAVERSPVDTATVTTGTLFSAPSRATEHEGPLTDSLTLPFPEPAAGQAAPAHNGWMPKYENCGNALAAINGDRAHGEAGHVPI